MFGPTRPPYVVLSSSDNDGFIGSETQTRGKLISCLKNQPSSPNRHSQCKIFPKSSSPQGFTFTTQGYHKESAEPKNDLCAKGRTAVRMKKITPQSHYAVFGEKKMLGK